MIARRAVIAGAAVALPGYARAALFEPEGDALAFDVLRDGSRIGSHIVRFRRSGGDLTVTIAVELAVGLGPIAFFRYRHDATELWSGDAPVHVETRTDDDGTPHHMIGRRQGDGFQVEGDRAALYIAPPSVLPGSHWNKRMIAGPALIDTQDGRLMNIKVTKAGPSRIGPYAATRYSITGDVTLDTFYADERWVGLDFMRKGSHIQYRPVA